MKLEVLICTTAGRLSKIDPKGLPQIDGVAYVVSCQNPENRSLDSDARSLIGSIFLRIQV